MASWTSNNYAGRYLQLTITETPHPTGNNSTLNWKLTSAGGSDTYYSIAPTTVTINGTKVYDKALTSWTARVFPAAKGSVSGSLVVTHDSNGAKTVTVGFSTRVYYSAASSYGGTMTLTTFDRSAPSVSFNTSGIGPNSFTINAASNVNCNSWDYSLNNGESWTNFSSTNGKSASKTVTGLSSNTTYNVKVRARKTYNYVYGSSSTSSVKTLGGANINSVNMLTADDSTVSIVMNVTVYNASYTNNLSIKNGSTNILTLSGVSVTTGSNTLTLTSSQRTTLLNAMKNVKSFMATYALSSYSGSTLIGTSTKTGIIQTTVANSSPTFPGFTYQDTNDKTVALTGSNQILIQNSSFLRVIATAATAKNGASISSYSVTVGNASKASTSTTIDVGNITQSGTIPIIVTAIDSRGWTSVMTTNVDIIEYTPIVLDDPNCILRRANNVETYCIANIVGSIKPVRVNSVNKNRFKSLEYKAYKTSESAPSEYTQDTSATISSTDYSFDFQSSNWALNLDSEFSYYVVVRVSDNLSSDTITFTVPKGIPLMSFRNKKVGINNRTPDKTLDINGTFAANAMFSRGGATGGLYFSSPLSENRKWGMFNYVWSGTDYNRLSIRSFNESKYYTEYTLEGAANNQSNYSSYDILTTKKSPDYVIESRVQTSTTVWNYKKFASGDALLYGVFTVKPTKQTAYAGLYYSEILYISVPFSVYNCSVVGIASDCHDIRNSDNSGPNKNISFRLIRTSSIGLNTNISVKMIVFGRWKA